MYASRVKALPSIYKIQLVRNDALKIGKHAYNATIFCRQLSKSDIVLSSEKPAEKPIKLYFNSPDPDHFSLNGVTEEMLAKLNRISSSISKQATTFTRDKIKGLKRRDLQKISKAVGISQTSKSSILVENILDHMQEYALTGLTFHPFCNPEKPNTIVPGDGDPLSIEIPAVCSQELGRLYLGELPSVTTILGRTKAKGDASRLENWEKKEIKRLGKENFKTTMNNTLDNGKLLHKTVADWLKEAHRLQKKEKLAFSNEFGLLQTSVSHKTFREDFFKNKLGHLKNLADDYLLYNQLKSLTPVLVDIEEVTAIESGVVSKILGFAGTLDCIAVYNGELCLIDWKTSKKKKKTLRSCFDYPVQLAAYAGAVNQDVAYPFSIEKAAIIFAYEDGSPADVHMLSCNQCEQYWDQWQSRLHVFKSFYDMSLFDDVEEEIVYLDLGDRKNEVFEMSNVEKYNDNDDIETQQAASIKSNLETIALDTNLLNGVTDVEKSLSTTGFASQFNNGMDNVLEEAFSAEVISPVVVTEGGTTANMVQNNHKGSTQDDEQPSSLQDKKLQMIKDGVNTRLIEVSYPVKLDKDSIFNADAGINDSPLVQETIMSQNYSYDFTQETNTTVNEAHRKIEQGIPNSADDLIVDSKQCFSDINPTFGLTEVEDETKTKIINTELLQDSVDIKTKNIANNRDNAVEKNSNTYCEKAESSSKDEAQPNMTTLKPGYPNPTPKTPKMKTGDAIQIANSYIKRKAESVKNYIASIWL